MILVLQIIGLLSQAYIWIVIISVFLSYFMHPFHPVRRGFDNLVEPLLVPLRKVIPPVGMLDFSPVVLIVLIQLVSKILVGFIIAIS